MIFENFQIYEKCWSIIVFKIVLIPINSTTSKSSCFFEKPSVWKNSSTFRKLIYSKNLIYFSKTHLLQNTHLLLRNSSTSKTSSTFQKLNYFKNLIYFSKTHLLQKPHLLFKKSTTSKTSSTFQKVNYFKKSSNSPDSEFYILFKYL